MEACERLPRFVFHRRGCSPMCGGHPARAKKVEKKYRRFTGRRGAPNTGKVIEIAKEKTRARNRSRNRSGNRKTNPEWRTLATMKNPPMTSGGWAFAKIRE